MQYNIDTIEGIKQFCIDRNYRVDVVGQLINLSHLFVGKSIHASVKQYFGEDSCCVIVPQIASSTENNDIFDENVMIVCTDRNDWFNAISFYIKEGN